MKSRSQRKADKERLLKKRGKIHADKLDWELWSQKRHLQKKKKADLPTNPILADTPKLCSCPMCGNQRPHVGPTLQEIKAAKDFREQLKDMEDHDTEQQN